MKKNFNINISGIIFHIDDDAYDKLNQYLQQLKRYFDAQEGGAEIVNDIEARIAELLAEKMTDKKQVVTIEDVTQIIEVMGAPQDMQDDDQDHSEPSDTPYERPKRLYRDPDNKIIGGIGGGMAAYFNIDPIWFRLAFVLSFFVVGPLAYIVFWIAIPMARTTSEKLEMRGKRVNINNIENSVREEVKEVGENLNKYTQQAKNHFRTNKNRYKETGSTVSKGVGEILKFGVRLLAIFSGILILIIGLTFVTAIILLLLAPDFPLIFTDGIPFPFHVPSFLDAFLTSGLSFTLSLLGTLILVGLPLIGLIVLGLRMIIGPRMNTGQFGSTALIVWLIALFTTTASAFFTAKHFTISERQRETVAELTVKDQPYTFSIKNGQNLPNSYQHTKYIFKNMESQNMDIRHNFRGIPGISFQHTTDSVISVEMITSAYGFNERDALQKCDRISYGVQIINNQVILDPFFSIPKEDKFRGQDLSIRVYLPDGANIRIDESLDDIANPWFLDANKVYVMENEKLTKNNN